MVAKAMVHNPPVLVLDEPTAGVDAALREQLWDYVKSLNRNGTTVLLTTHYLHEAEAMCDRIAVLAAGGILIDDTTDALLQRVEDRTLEIEISSPINEVPVELRRFGAILSGKRLVFQYGRGRGVADEILRAVHAAGLHVADMTTSQPNLEEVFLGLLRNTGGRSEGAG